MYVFVIAAKKIDGFANPLLEIDRYGRTRSDDITAKVSTSIDQPARPYYDTLLFLDINCYHAVFIYVFIGAVLSLLLYLALLMTL